MTLDSFRTQYMPGVPLEEIIRIAGSIHICTDPNAILSKDDRDKLLVNYELHKKQSSYVSIFGYSSIKDDYQKLINDYETIINSPTCPKSSRVELTKFVDEIKASNDVINQSIESLLNMINNGEKTYGAGSINELIKNEKDKVDIESIEKFIYHNNRLLEKRYEKLARVKNDRCKNVFTKMFYKINLNVAQRRVDKLAYKQCVAEERQRKIISKNVEIYKEKKRKEIAKFKVAYEKEKKTFDKITEYSIKLKELRCDRRNLDIDLNNYKDSKKIFDKIKYIKLQKEKERLHNRINKLRIKRGECNDIQKQFRVDNKSYYHTK